MSGTLWAALAGLGFGFFQAFNRRARAGFTIYWSTFILVLTSTLILGLAYLLTDNPHDLATIPATAYLNFGLAGIIHFFLGWTLLTTSQNRVGASRTGALIGAAPLFATLIAALAFQEYLSLPLLLGISTVVLGVYYVSASGPHQTGSSPSTWRDSLFGLGTALCFAVSPIFVRAGLDELPSPLLGVAIGMALSTLIYGLLLLFRREPLHRNHIPPDALAYQLAAAVFIGLSTWTLWVAIDLIPVAVVIALGRLNVPVVILLSLWLVGQAGEHVTARVLLGAALIVGGSLLLIAFG